MTSPAVLCVGYLSADRITTAVGAHGPVPGGAALYAALGAQAGAAAAGVVAAVGEDYPADWTRALSRAGVGLAHLQRRAGPTRATDLHYDGRDNRRSPHFEQTAWLDRTNALAPAIPDDLAGATITTVGPVPLDSLRAVLAQARRRDVKVLADTSLAFLRQGHDAFLALLPRLHVFAPSLEETRRLVPDTSDDDAAILLAASGATVLQKRGAQGAFLVRSGEPGGCLIAPVPSGPVLDPTGAGDATLGAFAAHLARGLGLEDAAAAAMRIGTRTVSAIGPAALGLRWGAMDRPEALIA